jgi:hypothetical protein
MTVGYPSSLCYVGQVGFWLLADALITFSSHYFSSIICFLLGGISQSHAIIWSGGRDGSFEMTEGFIFWIP